LSSGGYSTITKVGFIGFFLGGNKIFFWVSLMSTFGLDEVDFALVCPLKERSR
jgi:hypothetical protein